MFKTRFMALLASCFGIKEREFLAVVQGGILRQSLSGCGRLLCSWGERGTFVCWERLARNFGKSSTTCCRPVKICAFVCAIISWYHLHCAIKRSIQLTRITQV